MADRYEVSIIIPVFNEAQNLAMLLERLEALRVPHSEVIVVDDGSTDGCGGVAEKPGLRIIRSRDHGFSPLS